MLDKTNLRSKLPIVLFTFGYTLLFYLTCIGMSYIFPFVTGLLLAIILQPAIRLFERVFRMKRGVASFLCTLILFSLLFGLVFWGCIALISEIKSLIEWISQMDWHPIEQFLDRMNSYIGKIDARYLEENKEQLLSMAGNGIVLLSKLLSGLLSLLSSIPAVFTMVLVLIFSTYFFSKDLNRIKEWFISHFSDTAANQLSRAAAHGFSVMGKYLSSYLLLYTLTFAESLIIFFILKAPYPLVLSIAAGIADIIPILDPGAVYLPLAVSQLIQGRPVAAAALVIAYLVITLSRQLLEPKLISSSIQVHPLCMLAALYFALVAGNLLVLVYFTLLFVFYQILRKVELLPPLFSRSGRAGRWHKKQKCRKSC